MASSEAIRFSVQIAQALKAAPAAHIVHRDVKPANILLSASGVKLLDFGLAKLAIADDPDATQTIAGAVMGSPGYMSPEQIQSQPVDARSDILSFGAVLHELLSGTRAFPGNSAAAAMVGTLHDAPASCGHDAPPVFRP